MSHELLSLRFFPDDQLHRARSLFPHTTEGRIYLNHAASSPLSTRVVDAVKTHLVERSAGRLETFELDIPMVKETREMLRALINAESADRIALMTNTSAGINVVASGIPWKSGDIILSNSAEFPANVWPYLNLKPLGVELDVIQSPDGSPTWDTIVGAIKPRTRMIALSAVQFLSGYRADLETIGEVCRNRGIIFAVDAIQAVGAVCVDVQKMKIDALAAGGHKWLMSPHGTGFLYLTEELQSGLMQKHLGWLGVREPWDFHDYTQPLATSARRYEGGNLNLPSLWGMHTALKTIQEYTPRAIESHLLSLTGVLTRGLESLKEVHVVSPTAAENRAGIVTMDIPERLNPVRVLALLRERKITPAVRQGKIRFSPHFYSDATEMESTVHAVKEILDLPEH